MTPPTLTPRDWLVAALAALVFVVLPAVIAILAARAARRDRTEAADLLTLAKAARVTAERREVLSLALLTHVLGLRRVSASAARSPRRPS